MNFQIDEPLPIGAGLVRAGGYVRHNVGAVLGGADPVTIDRDARSDRIATKAEIAVDRFDKDNLRTIGRKRWKWRLRSVVTWKWTLSSPHASGRSFASR